MSLPLLLHRTDCRCKHCLLARFKRDEIAEKLFILAQLGHTGVISPEELTGDRYVEKKLRGAA